MQRSAAANGWFAALGVRNAALEFSLSISSIQRDCGGASATSKSMRQSARKQCARARDAVARLAGDYPGDVATGILEEGDDAAGRFSQFANDEPCPALDLETGKCELYESRPMTCRTFGPPVLNEDGLGVCELCYHGASDEEIAACEMKSDPDDLEAVLLKEVEESSGVRGNTIVAFCLAI